MHSCFWDTLYNAKITHAKQRESISTAAVIIFSFTTFEEFSLSVSFGFLSVGHIFNKQSQLTTQCIVCLYTYCYMCIGLVNRPGVTLNNTQT